ncbi:transcriptional regulator TACO1-like protein [Cokeromyces recurvatus]|uniref:transcriptional regulator TACO1-like protein n=1 Tax=Cokeromyces recurvatus TaxID=90255 RepID=UPI00221E605A|nr:transcriptional regulator TACO1-like protein [Cokeromyces recurvatus]KAI7907217.1 transcriptional regulator TACO1-like protein [Cokeromyces recurvatus]
MLHRISITNLTKLNAFGRVQPLWKYSSIYLQQQQRFAGHNKWSKVKHTKGAKDAKKSVLYSKISLEIVSAVRAGGPDPTVNNSLQAVLNRAKAASMPKDSIENAFKKAQDKNKDDLEKITYECIGPGGIALIVEALTDKKSRTVKEVKEVLNRVGGSVSSVGYLFDKKGKVVFSAGETGHSFEQIMDNAIDCGAEDIEEDPGENLIEVTCEFSELNTVSKALMDHQYEVQKIEAAYIPLSTVEVKDEETIELVEKCLDNMEDLGDVVKVHSNAVLD